MLLTVNKILKVTILMVLLNITLFVNGLPAITDNGDNSCNCGNVQLNMFYFYIIAL